MGTSVNSKSILRCPVSFSATHRKRSLTVRAGSSHAADSVLDRRAAVFGITTAAFTSAFLSRDASAEELEKSKKVVAVPYTPYVVSSDSSDEAMEVAKALKDAGARLYGAFWCENCNKQKELLGKQAMEIINYVECFPDGVYQNSEGHEDVIKPDGICTGYTSAWPLWVVPKGEDDEIGIAGQIKKPRDLQRLIKEAKGEKVDLVKYFTTLDME